MVHLKKGWWTALSLVCTLFIGLTISSTASAARTVRSLPFTENFNTNNYSDLVWITQGATHTWVSNAGWNGSGAAKFTAPMAEGYSGLGQFLMANSTLAPEQLNIRFLIYHGTLWQSLGPGGKLIIMNRDGNRGRPMAIMMNSPDGRWQTWGNCDGTVCRYGGGDYWPNGQERLRVGASPYRSHEWICIEMEANTRTGIQKLYIDTQDGAMSGLYIERPMDSNGTGGTWSYVDLIGTYANSGSIRNDPENYFIIDEVAINTTRIGPPAGFRTGTTPTTPRPPSNLRVP